MSLPKNVRQSKSNREIGPAEPSIGQAESSIGPTATHFVSITATGRSAVAVIALQGPDAAAIAKRCFEPATQRRYCSNEIRFGSWTGPGIGDTPAATESVVVVPLSQDHWEIHCHGGSAAPRRLMQDLIACGALPMEQDEWFVRENRLVGEAEQVLARCLTSRTAAIAVDQVRGAFREEISGMLMIARETPHACDAIRAKSLELLKYARFTTRLGEPLHVVLVGPPNVGKSSLMNRLVGFDRSITHNAAGTTRDVLHADTVIDGLPIRLSDTAGIRDSDETIEAQGIARARRAAATADLIIEVSEPANGLDRSIDPNLQPPLDLRLGMPDPSQQFQAIGVLNKSDLLSDPGRQGNWDVATNAMTGEGVDSLLRLIAQRLGRLVPRPGTAVPLTERQAGLLGEIAAATQPYQMVPRLQRLLGVGDA